MIIIVRGFFFDLQVVGRVGVFLDVRETVAYQVEVQRLKKQ